MNIILIFLIAISLSMDTFSLSLAYGTLSFSKKEILMLSLIVGLYHFFMPILGMYIGLKLLTLIPINSDIVISIIFAFIGMDMIMNIFKKEKSIKKLNIFEMLLFGLVVSIDSFSIGIGLNIKNIITCSIIFCLMSFIFTLLGLILGKKIKYLIGDVALFIGGFTLILIGIFHVI